MLVRVLAASIAGGIAFFILGFVIYGLILDPMVMKPNMIEYPGLMKDPPVWVPLRSITALPPKSGPNDDASDQRHRLCGCPGVCPGNRSSSPGR